MYRSVSETCKHVITTFVNSSLQKLRYFAYVVVIFCNNILQSNSNIKKTMNTLIV
jgi:hypothetical protein